MIGYNASIGFLGETLDLSTNTKAHFHRHAICIYIRLHNGAFSGRDMPYRGQYRKTSGAAMKTDVFEVWQECSFRNLYIMQYYTNTFS